MTAISRIIDEAIADHLWRKSARLEARAFRADVAGKTEVADMLRGASERVVGAALRNAGA